MTAAFAPGLTEVELWAEAEEHSIALAVQMILMKNLYPYLSI